MLTDKINAIAFNVRMEANIELRNILVYESEYIVLDIRLWDGRETAFVLNSGSSLQYPLSQKTTEMIREIGQLFQTFNQSFSIDCAHYTIQF